MIACLLVPLAVVVAVVLGQGGDPARRLRAPSPDSLATTGGRERTVARLRAMPVGWWSRRVDTAQVEAVRGVIEGWAAAVRSGRPADAALASVLEELPAGDPVLARTRAAVAVGADLGGALRADAEVLRADVARRAVVAMSAAWLVARDHGGRLADALDRVAGAMRADARHVAHVRAELAGPRATARLLAVLPLFALTLGASLGMRPWSVLLGDDYGRLALVAGTVLDVGGLVWVGRIAAAAERAV